MRPEREAGLGHAGLGLHCERGGQSLKGFCVFWPCCETCGILVPQPGSNLGSLHWKHVLTPGESESERVSCSVMSDCL